MPRNRQRNRSSTRRSGRGFIDLVESFEPRVLLAIDVSVGLGTPVKSIVWTDGDGTVGTIRVSGGAATATFNGPVVSQTTSGGTSVVTGTNVAMTNLVITGANPSVTVTTSKTGDGHVTLGAMSAAGPVNAVNAKGAVLTGTTSLSNGIGRLDLAGMQGATVTINRGSLARLQDASVTVAGDVSDTSITSQQPFKLLRVGRWLAGGAPADQVTTLRINTLQSAGDFAANLSLSGNGQQVGKPILNSAKVGGTLSSGNWNVQAGTGKVSAAAVASNWRGTFTDVSNFAVTGDLAGNLTADSIKSLTAGTITGSTIQLNKPFAAGASDLGKLTSKGAISNLDLRSQGDIGSVTAASIAGSIIYAGVTQQGNPHNLPSSAAAFPNATTIRSVTIRNRTPGVASMSDTNIAAAHLGKLSLGVAQTNNGGKPFGLAALDVKSITATTLANEPIHVVNLTDPSQSITNGDAVVRIF